MARRGFRFGNSIGSNKMYLIIGIIIVIAAIWFFKPKSKFGEPSSNYLVINNTTAAGLNVRNMQNAKPYYVYPNTISKRIPFNTQQWFLIQYYGPDPNKPILLQTHSAAIFFNNEKSWSPNGIPLVQADDAYKGSVYAKYTELTGLTYTFTVREAKINPTDNVVYPYVGEPDITPTPTTFDLEMPSVLQTTPTPTSTPTISGPDIPGVLPQMTLVAPDMPGVLQPISLNSVLIPVSDLQPILPISSSVSQPILPISSSVSQPILPNSVPTSSNVSQPILPNKKTKYILKNGTGNPVTLKFTSSASSPISVTVAKTSARSFEIINTVPWTVTARDSTAPLILPANMSYKTILIAPEFSSKGKATGKYILMKLM